MQSFLKFCGKALNFAKKAFIVIAVYFVVVNLFAYFIYKDQPKNTVDPVKESRKEIYKLINDKELNKTKEGRQTIAVNRELYCGFLGEGCTKNPSDGDKNFGYSIFGYITKGITFPYGNPPASGMYYVYNGLQNAGFVPKTMAAEGIGFAAIKPLSGIWKIFRDVSYLLLVMVLIGIGFMIMFRVKINPQTVISLENALPRIVLSLVLITFSFAIAGFLIDAMYIAIAIGISIFGVNVNTKEQVAFALGSGWKLFDGVFLNADIWAVGPALLNIIPSVVSTTLKLILAGVSWYGLLAIPHTGNLVGGKAAENVIETGSTIATVVKIVMATILIPLSLLYGGFILSLFIFITALFVFFRIFFLLLKSYIIILLMIIFSPIILLFEAIPGRNMFSLWFRTLVSNLLAFPLVAILLIVSSLIVSTPTTSSSGTFWSPPFLYSADPKAFSILVGIGILFMIPNLIKLVQQFVGVRRDGPGLGIGPGLFFGGIAGIGGAAMGTLNKFGSIGYTFKYAEDLPFVGNWIKDKKEAFAKRRAEK